MMEAWIEKEREREEGSFITSIANQVQSRYPGFCGSRNEESND